MHTFELSGLGKAPFQLINPKQHPLEKGHIFFCEHCGTTIKNRFFIKSDDGKVSVVGIDCAKKTNDLGLIDGIKRMAREARAEEREKARIQKLEEKHAQERIANNGLTNSELADKLLDQRVALLNKNCEEMNEHPILCLFDKHGFEVSMHMQARTGQPFSHGQLSIMKVIYTKKVSGARKGSKAFKAAYIECSSEIDDLQLTLTNVHEKALELRNEWISIVNS